MTPYDEAAHNSSMLSHQYTCAPENFSWNNTKRCEKVVYEDYNSIVAEVSILKQNIILDDKYTDTLYLLV